MKVMHLLPSLSSGGVEQVVLELGKGLTERGVDNVVVSAGGRLLKQLLADGSRHIERPIGKKSFSTLFEVPALRRLIAKEKPDILHVHSRVPAWVGYLAWRKLPVESRPHFISSFHGFYSVNRYSKVMTKGERVIAVSRCIRDHIISQYPSVDATKIRVIPNAVDPDIHSEGYEPSGDWLTRWKIQNPELHGRFTLCLPGRITRIKGHSDLIPILQGLLAKGIPAHAVIVGEAKKGKEAYLRELKSAFRAAGLNDHVTWTGDRRDLRDVMAVCNVILSLTQVPESFGKSTLEALAMGKSVVGYDHGGVAEQLSTFLPEGLVPLGDTERVVEILAQWHHQEPTTPEHIPAPYRMEDLIQAHLDCYQELIGK